MRLRALIPIDHRASLAKWILTRSTWRAFPPAFARASLQRAPTPATSPHLDGVSRPTLSFEVAPLRASQGAGNTLLWGTGWQRLKTVGRATDEVRDRHVRQRRQY